MIQNISKQNNIYNMSLNLVKEDKVVSVEKKETKLIDTNTFSSKDNTYISKLMKKNNIKITDENYTEVKNIKKGIDKLKNNMTDSAIKDLLKEKVMIEKMDIKELSNYLNNQNKAEVFSNTSDIKENEDKSVKKQINEAMKELMKAGLPATNKNISSIISFKGKIKEISNMDKNVILKTIKDNKKLTVGNLYKNIHSNLKTNEKKINFKKLDKQIEKVLEKNNIDLTKENKKITKEFIENDIEITNENINKYKDYLNTEIDQKLLMKEAFRKIKAGKDILSVKINETDLDKLTNVLKKVKPEEIDKIISKDRLVNLKNIYLSFFNKLNKGNYKKSQNNEQLKANLIQIKNKLTAEVMGKFINTNIKIENKPLKDVLKDISNIEDYQIEREMNKNSLNVTEKNKEIFRLTLENLNYTRKVRSKTIKAIKDEEIKFTLNDISKYEKNLTKKRAKFNDNISKLDDEIRKLLSKNKINDTKINKEVLKVFIKNKIDFNKNDFNEIKLIKKDLDYIGEKLNPNMVSKMIKNKMNLNDMNIKELLKFIDENGPNEIDNLYKNIHEFNKLNDISKTERKKMIDIYRMLHKMKKSKGEVIGYLKKNNMKLTIENLFKASKHLEKNVKIDIKSDDIGNFDSDFKIKQDILTDLIRNSQPERIRKIYSENHQNVEKINMLNIIEEEDINEVRNMIKNIEKIDDKSIMFMKDNNIKINIENLKIINTLMKDPNILSKNINNIIDDELREKLKNSQDKLEKAEEIDKILNDLVENIDRIENEKIENSIQETQNIKKIIDLQEKIDTNKYMYKIPVTINDEVSTLNIAVLNEIKDDFTATLMLETKKLGNINLYIKSVNKKLNITVESKNIKYIKENINILKGFLNEVNYELGDVKYEEGTK